MSSSPSQVNTHPLEENYATLTCWLVIKDGPWRWLFSISTHQILPVSTPVNGEVMKVCRDPSYDLMLNEVIFTGSTTGQDDEAQVPDTNKQQQAETDEQHQAEAAGPRRSEKTIKKIKKAKI